MDKFLRLPAVKEVTGFSRTSIYRGMKNGEFPQKISTGINTVAWLESEIEAWINSRIRASRTI